MIVTIPTLGNRPEKLKRLTDALKGHDVRVFDYSMPEREELIRSLVDKVGLNEEVVRRTFSQGYGGNRNFIMASTINDVIVSMDDDVLPARIKVDDEPSEGIANFHFADDCTFENYDVVSELGRFIGKRAGDLDMRKGGIIEYSYSPFRLVGDAPSDDSRVIASFPMISYDWDNSAHAHGEYGKMVFTGMKPAVLKSRWDIYQCYATDNKVVSAVPFSPTELRYEDTLNSNMLDRLDLGCSVMIGKDVVHVNPNGADVDKEIAAHMSCGLIFAAYHKNADLNEAADQLIGVTHRYAETRDFVESRMMFMASLGVPVSFDSVGKIQGLVQSETYIAAQTFQIWDKVRDYLMQ